MFTYTLVRVAASIGSPPGTVAPYEAALHDHASKGHELVQIFVENPAAVPREYVLIFKCLRAA